MVRVLTPSDMQLFKVSIPGPKPLVKVTRDGRISYTDTHAETYIGNTGVQRVDFGKAVMTYDQVTGSPNISKNQRLLTTAPYFTLDPNRTTTGSLETSGTVPAGQFPVNIFPTSQVLYAAKHRISMSLTNFASIACHVEVRWLLCKNNETIGPVQAWDLDLGGLRMGQNAASVPGGVLTAPVTGYPISSYYGEDPENNITFKKYWKTLTKREFVLPAGTTIRFEATRPINKMIREMDMNAVSGKTFLRGLTFMPLFIFKPSPVDAYLTSDGPGTRIVNTGTCKIGYMQTDTLIFYTVKDKSTPANVAFSANVSNTFGNMNQAHIDDDDDVQAVVEA